MTLANLMQTLWTFVALSGVDWKDITRQFDDLLSQGTAQIARSRQPVGASEEYDVPPVLFTGPTSQPKDSFKSFEEMRLENFWRGYYQSVRRFNEDMSKLDWVAYYKNHGYQINSTDGSRVLFAPVVAIPKMEWGLRPGEPTVPDLRAALSNIPIVETLKPTQPPVPPVGVPGKAEEATTLAKPRIINLHGVLGTVPFPSRLVAFDQTPLPPAPACGVASAESKTSGNRQLIDDIVEIWNSMTRSRDDAITADKKCVKELGEALRILDSYNRTITSDAQVDQLRSQVLNAENTLLTDEQLAANRRDQAAEIILRLIESSSAVLAVTDQDISRLKREGVSERIIDALRQRQAVPSSHLRGDMEMKALLWLGTIHFDRREYKEADFYLTKIHTQFPDSPFAAKAIKLSVICKQLSQGPVLIGRAIEESNPIDPAPSSDLEPVKDGKPIANSPDRDYKIAEFYRRTGHPGAAYFYFELVQRRYPGTSYADCAALKMFELRSEVERKKN